MKKNKDVNEHKDDISEETQSMIDKSMKNLENGIASKPIDLSEFAE